MWLSPFTTARAKSGAATWNAKLSQMSPASSAWCSSVYTHEITPPALWPSRNTGTPGVCERAWRSRASTSAR